MLGICSRRNRMPRDYFSRWPRKQSNQRPTKAYSINSLKGLLSELAICVLLWEWGLTEFGNSFQYQTKQSDRIEIIFHFFEVNASSTRFLLSPSVGIPLECHYSIEMYLKKRTNDVGVVFHTHTKRRTEFFRIHIKRATSFS